MARVAQVPPALSAAALAAARRRIHRHALLPHTAKKWAQVAGALKGHGLYDAMIAVPRARHESLQQYTRRFVHVFTTERRRALLVNLHSSLYDGGVQRNTVEAVALPHLQATCILSTVGLTRVVGAPDGVARVAEALEAAGVPYVVQTL